MHMSLQANTMAVYMRQRNISRHIFTGLSLCLCTKAENAIDIFIFCKASLTFYDHTSLKVKHQRKAAYRQLFTDAFKFVFFNI